MMLGLATNYDAIVSFIKRRHGVRVNRWRSNMTGSAWQTTYADGTNIHWIEAPQPRSPISLAVFLHEVGHHVIGFNQYRLRCEEEFAAWSWSLETMRSLGVEPDIRTYDRFDQSIRYAIEKAQQRGLKQLPIALAAFNHSPLVFAA